MKNIKTISYQYTSNILNPINYHIRTDTVTTSLNYKDALEIAYAVIDSLGGSYNELDDLVERFEDKINEGIKIESI